jgi:hypothetical protein
MTTQVCNTKPPSSQFASHPSYVATRGFCLKHALINWQRRANNGLTHCYNIRRYRSQSPTLTGSATFIPHIHAWTVKKKWTTGSLDLLKFKSLCPLMTIYNRWLARWHAFISFAMPFHYSVISRLRNSAIVPKYFTCWISDTTRIMPKLVIRWTSHFLYRPASQRLLCFSTCWHIFSDDLHLCHFRIVTQHLLLSQLSF